MFRPLSGQRVKGGCDDQSRKEPVLVLGATGTIGRAVVAALLEAGYPVTVSCVRIMRAAGTVCPMPRPELWIGRGGVAGPAGRRR